MNVLIASAGRRASLLEAFRRAAAARGGAAFAGDRDPLAPALYLADGAFLLPAVGATDYETALFESTERHAITLVVPTIDPELPCFASAAPRFAAAGRTLLVSSPELVRIASDKWLTVNHFAGCGIRTPRSWLPSDLPASGLPRRLFVKPRQGSASKDAFPVARTGLEAALTRVFDPIVQEELDGTEITVDALLDLDGRPLHYVPRARLRTLAGESIQGVTLADDVLRPWLLHALEAIAEAGGRGPVTLQAFLTGAGPVLTEINPRFGGGFPLTEAAGGHYPDWILERLAGRALAARIGDYRVGLYMTRYYREHFVEEPLIGSDGSAERNGGFFERDLQAAAPGAGSVRRR